MDKIPLSLDPNASAGGGPTAPAARSAPGKSPVMGYFAVGFGVLGIFTHGWIFTPMGFLCSIIALVMGQISWAVIGLFLSVIGLLTSPILLGLIGLGFFYKDISGFIQQVLAFLHM